MKTKFRVEVQLQTYYDTTEPYTKVHDSECVDFYDLESAKELFDDLALIVEEVS